ncbi:MAG TPA: aminopeptidase N [Actinomycetota bacterium]|nr:aminopeptidase N [Actinomycetota bacterium]
MTRDEAKARAALITNPDYIVTLDLTHGEKTFSSETTVTFRCSQPGASTFIDLTAPSVSEIRLNGADLPLDAHDGHRIRLDDLRAENTLHVVATCAFSNSGTGLHFFRDPVDGNPYLHTQFESREAHKVYASFDQPNIKGTFRFSVVAPEGWVVVSNTEALEQPVDGAAGTWTFGRTKRMSSYITAIVAGPYHVVHDRHKDIDLRIFCRRSLARYLDPDELFTITKQGFDFFERYFDYPYVFGKYDQLFVPEFNAGAMENAGCVTFAEAYIFRSRTTDAARENRAGTILHEMAHMWFGDLVTMDWWDDLWLNESFATYMGTLSQARATRFTNAWTRFSQGQKLWAMVQDQQPTTHPIVADAPDTETARTNFDGISYAKGASVLKQLVAWVGEEPFMNGIRSYFRRYEYENADLDAFLGALEESSGRDLGQWSKEWLETAGVNTFRVRSALENGAYTDLSLEQSAPPEWPMLRSHRIGVGLYDLAGGSLQRRRHVELDAIGASTPVIELVGEREADLVLPNDDDHSYTKIRLDKRSLATLTEHLADLEDPLARALCWTAAIDQLRDAELAARRYVRLVVNNIHTETDPGAVQQLLGGAAQAITLYGDPANRDAARYQLAARALESLRAAEPASDLQLLWARAFIGNARSDEHVAIVRGLLDGKESFDGLSVDTDLRWLIVHGLSGLGAIGDDVIQAELERDPTDQGQRYAAGARAARPTPDAKAEAWDRIVNDAGTPLATIRSLIGGFIRFDQSELLEPYRRPYFDAIEQMWDGRAIEVAVTFVHGVYPLPLMGPELIAQTDAYLDAHNSAAPPIRRYLIENRDDAARALKARAVDGAAGSAQE